MYLCLLLKYHQYISKGIRHKVRRTKRAGAGMKADSKQMSPSLGRLKMGRGVKLI